jgi:hypothetical protein
MPMNPRLLRPTQGGFASPDADARAYLAAVRIADGSNLEPAVAKAISDFVIGCKADGIWTAIKASCLLGGARTLSGALVPLKGPAPTNNNFVSGDYNRKTGLKGNGGGKYLGTNYIANSNPQNDNHLGFYRTETDSAATLRLFMGTGESAAGSCRIWSNNGSSDMTSNANTAGGLNNVFVSNTRNNLGLIAYSRTASNNTNLTAGADSNSSSLGSTTILATEISVFRMTANFTASNQGTDSRILFYSTGNSLNLGLLQTRLDTLKDAFALAIP